MRLLISLGLLFGSFALAGCIHQPSPNELVKVNDSADVCPNHLCKVGTELFYQDGSSYGVVTKVGVPSASDPKKPAMEIEGDFDHEHMNTLPNADETGDIYIKR
jgi:hypothetical protein